MNLAILIQDDLVSQVGNELGNSSLYQIVAAWIAGHDRLHRLEHCRFARRSPQTSRKLPDLRMQHRVLAVHRLILMWKSSTLKKFQNDWSNANAVLLISDGLDTSRGFDSTAVGHTLDIERAINEANRRKVSVFSFYAPSVGLTSHSSLASIMDKAH